MSVKKLSLSDLNNKIITSAFIVFSALVAYVISYILEVWEAYSGFVARMLQNEILRQGIPLLSAFIVFLSIRFNLKLVKWADEVVNEVSKVVWPSRRDSVAMTVVVSVIIVIAGCLLAVFDLASGYVYRQFVDLLSRSF